MGLPRLFVSFLAGQNAAIGPRPATGHQRDYKGTNACRRRHLLGRERIATEKETTGGERRSHADQELRESSPLSPRGAEGLHLQDRQQRKGRASEYAPGEATQQKAAAGSSPQGVNSL